MRNRPARPERSRSSRWAPGAQALADASVVVREVAFGGRSPNFAPFERSSHAAVVRAVALGSIRWYLRLAPTVEGLLPHPRRVPEEIRALLAVSAHQIEYSRNPVHATVLAAVDAARLLECRGTTGLVNAVLRRYLAEHELLLARTDQDPAKRAAHPAWLVAAVESAWPQHGAQILAANNEHPPMVLRVDLTRRARDDYLAELEAAGVSAHAVPWIDTAVQLERPVAVADLPGFGSSEATAGAEAGHVSIQDAGAQLVPRLLAAEPGMRVLDACAAPGGKSGHLLEHTPELKLVAVDIAADRVQRIAENLTRLRRTAQVVVGDVRDPTTFWDGVPFDRILVDAPCSSTGVIRRHPDIKLLRKPGDIGAFAAMQLQILRSAFRMLAPGGRLVYSTCSVLPEENEGVVERLLENEPDARPAPLVGGTGAGEALAGRPTAAERTAHSLSRGTAATAQLAPGALSRELGAQLAPGALSRELGAQLAPGALSCELGAQLLPGAEAGTDGFYYACVEKTTVGT